MLVHNIQTHQAMQQTQLTQGMAPTVNMIPAQPIQYLNPISMSQHTPIYNQIPYLYTQIPAWTMRIDIDILYKRKWPEK